MARLILLLLLCLPALGQKVPCKTDLVPGGALSTSTPTDVVVDGNKRVFLLYGRQGAAECLNASGEVVMSLTTGEPDSKTPTRFRALNLWCGTGSAPCILATQDGPEGATWVLTPSGNGLKAVRLKGAPDPVSDDAVLARENDRYYVLDNSVNPRRLYIYSTGGGFIARGSFPNLGRVRKLALDRKHNLYALTDAGLVVYNRQGSKRYTLPGARTFTINREDRLAAAGQEWVRKFDLQGLLLAEGRAPQGQTQPEAISLTADGSMYVYYSGGHVALYDPKAELADESDFDPPSSPAGYGLDTQGRLFTWDNQSETLVMRAPNGKIVNRASYTASAYGPEKLVNPTDLALSPSGTVWVAEAGGCRLHRWSPSQGWMEPVAVGIRAGASRAEPLSVKCDGQGQLVMLVAPPGSRGNLYIQRRDANGKLMGQKDLGPVDAGAVVKLAVQPAGDYFLYRSDAEMRPTLEHFDAKGIRIGMVGGKDPGFTLSKGVATGIFLKPEEDLVPYKTGLIIPTAGQLVYLDHEMKIFKVLDVSHNRHAPGAGVTMDFGGSFFGPDGVLYVTDTANNCVHKILLR